MACCACWPLIPVMPAIMRAAWAAAALGWLKPSKDWESREGLEGGIIDISAEGSRPPGNMLGY